MQSPPEITHQVIVDEPDLDPLNDFKEVAQTLAKIIIKSDPQFTVGIYGEWGTGKTTLMRNICKEITDGSKDQKIIPVWFSAWRYGLEEHHATVALMKTIARQIDGSVDKFKFVRAALIYGSLNFVREVADNWVFKPITGRYVFRCFGRHLGAKLTQRTIVNFVCHCPATMSGRILTETVLGSCAVKKHASLDIFGQLFLNIHFAFPPSKNARKQVAQPRHCLFSP